MNYFKKMCGALIIFFQCGFYLAQKNQAADAVLGLWLTGNGKAHIQISKYGEKFAGKIVWLRQPNNAEGTAKLDTKNPDPVKRKNTILGLTNLLGFTYSGNNKYENGSIYDPENGKTYSCRMILQNTNTLNVRGFIGISLIGRSDVWTRVTDTNQK